MGLEKDINKIFSFFGFYLALHLQLDQLHLHAQQKQFQEKASVDRLAAAQSYHLAFFLHCYIDIFLRQLPCIFGIEQYNSLAAINS